VTPAALRPVVVIVALDRTSLVTSACKTKGDEMSMFRVMSTGVKLVLPDAWPVAESTGADAEKLKDWIWTLLAGALLMVVELLKNSWPCLTPWIDKKILCAAALLMKAKKRKKYNDV